MSIRLFLVLTSLGSCAALWAGCGSSSSATGSAFDADSGAAADARGSAVASSGGEDGSSTPPPPAPKVTNEAIKVGSVTRTFVLVVPFTYDPSKKYPLVFAFHGSYGNGQQFRDFYKFESGSREAAIVVYPDGVQDNKEWDLDSIPDRNPDVALFDAMLGGLQATLSIDTARVFATGWSNGGFFANRLACSRSRSVKAIVSLSGGAPYDNQNLLPRWKPDFVKCPNQGGVASMAIHGIDDPEVSVDSGEFSAIYWAFVNKCQDSRTSTPPAPCEAYIGCPVDKPSVFCPMPKLGHGIPPAAAEVAWNFFKTIP